MSHSQRPSVRELRAVFRLVGEVRELGHDMHAWKQHMLTELIRLLGGTVGLAHELPLRVKPECLHDFIGMAEVGWATDRDAQFFRSIMHEPVMEDAALVRYVSMLKPESVTCTLQDLIDPNEWHADVYFNEVRKPLNADSFINTGCVLPASGCVHGMCLNRALGERPFGKRERELVQIFHEELVHIWQQAGPPDPINALAPRQRQIVERFRAGDSEKQIAFRLGLSRQTVHAYVKALYRRMNVSGRFELLQKLTPKPSRFRPRLSIESYYQPTGATTSPDPLN